MRRPPVETRIVTVGDDSYGVLFPDELVARLGLKAGQFLEMVESPGGITLRPMDSGIQVSDEPKPFEPDPGAARGD